MKRKWLLLAAVAVLFFLLRKGFAPLLIGLILAYVLDPFVTWLTRHTKASRLTCIFVASLSLLAALLLLIYGFAHIISGNLQSESFADVLAALKGYYADHEALFTRQLSDKLGVDKLTKALRAIGSSLFKWFVGLVAGIYLLKDKSFFLRSASQLLHLVLDQKTHGLVREIAFEINDVIASFIKGVFIDSVLVAFLSSLVLTLLQVDYAVFVGCFAGLTNIIPYFGPLLGMVPGAVLAYANGGAVKALLVVGALFLIQQIECNLLYPRIVGKSTGLHPLYVLVTVSAAGAYGGLAYMLLAVPLAGILRVLFCKWALAQQPRPPN